MDHAPAGTKRIANLLRSEEWKAELLERWLWEQGDDKRKACLHLGDAVDVIWDESKIEKPESLHAKRLCAVRSVKARRLKRIKKGYLNLPGGRPVFVPGFHWFQVVVTGLKGAPTLAHFLWWTTCGQAASTMREEERQALQQMAKQWRKP